MLPTLGICFALSAAVLGELSGESFCRAVEKFADTLCS